MPLLTAQEPQSAPSMRIIHPCSVPAEVGSLPDSVSCPVRNNPVRYRILVWTSSLRCDSLLVRFTCRDLLLPTLPWFPSSPRTFSLGSSTSPELEPAQRDLHQTPRYRELRFFFHILFLPFSAAASQCFFSIKGPWLLGSQPRASQKLSSVLAGLSWHGRNGAERHLSATHHHHHHHHSLRHSSLAVKSLKSDL